MESLHLSCAICGKSPSNKCSRCKGIAYCSKECQRVDWQHHKLTCKEVKGAAALEVDKIMEIGLMRIFVGGFCHYLKLKESDYVDIEISLEHPGEYILQLQVCKKSKDMSYYINSHNVAVSIVGRKASEEICLYAMEHDNCKACYESLADGFAGISTKAPLYYAAVNPTKKTLSVEASY